MSRSLRLYSTSGFENPLTLFLVALFAVILLAEPGAEPPWGRLALVAALAATNRLDTLLLFLPALGFLVLAHRRSVGWGRLLLGFTPLAGWLLFSLFYYGFLFPNTAYAKLSSAIPRWLYLQKGALYVADLVLADPVSAAVLATGAAATLVWLWRWWRERQERAGRLAALGAGAILYSAYVVWIGGDFLSGRFWAAPVLVALVVAVASAGDLRAWLRWPRLATHVGLAAATLALALAARAAASEVRQRVRGRVNERSVAHLRLTGELSWRPTRGARDFRRAGRALRARAELQGRATQRHALIGIAGVTAGPEVRIIDGLALGDPLLARLTPVRTRKIRKIGHLPRRIPAGYLDARETGSLDGMDPALAAYYSRLRLIVSGPLMSRERLRTLVAFNLGAYDHLRDEYERRAPRRRRRTDGPAGTDPSTS